MNRRILFPVILFLSAVSCLSAQTPTPHFVVIDDARAEINRLLEENRAMAEVSRTLEAENADLEKMIGDSREFIYRINDLIDKIVVAKGPIHTALQSINESDTRRDLQAKMNELRESEYELEKTKRREYESISRSNDQIESNRRMIAVNNVRIEKNDQRIAYLRECEAYTLNENRDVDTVMDAADEIRRQVAELLGR